jgi:hypothetical protein
MRPIAINHRIFGVSEILKAMILLVLLFLPSCHDAYEDKLLGEVETALAQVRTELVATRKASETQLQVAERNTSQSKNGLRH